jgi:hypothetical protein
MTARFDPDSPYLVHSHAAALHFTPLPVDTLRALHIIRSLMVHTTDPAEVAWLEAREAFLTANCADCPPVVIRNTEPRKVERSFPRHEAKYALRGHGPRNASGRARS